ncbi:L-2-amino-thiazoline-4-carboxylic acid hydrolase [Anaerocolumna jejuensis DSM 15929]|uniref:L-2-amino-thiazoline-4-carboxylic acid hydrolase n=1 Tax=Anaerocolumna jejuensis DSM 15929 TaxID=1121322 RepID=A0A1M6KUM7_9FIRM|nr:L-2-amino-thiazoline-4-carboxylic acid hydrolase [Anaerocolumna jejuensis]SHJ62728.1 L-2-amino-thiazoline-4-carboxylic acid hydrolase [Anaerocolumna jejuensis DSM 15929]
MSDERIERKEAVEAVRVASRHFADLYFYFVKALVEDLGEEKAKEIVQKVLFERSIERAKRMEDKAEKLEKEKVPENIFCLTDVPFLGWVKELGVNHCPYGEAWLSRYQEHPWFREFAAFYCDVTDTSVAELFTRSYSHKLTKNVVLGDESCERIYYKDEKVASGEYTYGKKED